MSSENEQRAATPAVSLPPADERTAIAWQPFTAKGVASFAKASSANVLLVELLVSGLLTAAVFWFLYTAWLPAIWDGIRKLPDAGAVLRGVLPEATERARILIFRRRKPEVGESLSSISRAFRAGECWRHERRAGDPRNQTEWSEPDQTGAR